MNHVKAGYVSHNDLINVTESDAKALTHINIAFGYCVNSEIAYAHLNNVDSLNQIRKYNPTIKILLSVGGWGAGGFSPMAATEENRAKFACSGVRAVQEVGLDGIDIDWEYPCIDSANIEASPDDKHNFTLMLQKMREELNKIKTENNEVPMLTIAAGAGEYFVECTEIPEVCEQLDYVSIMTYDMRGSGRFKTGHHTNLFSPDIPQDDISADKAVKIFNEAGIPKDKIVLGAAFYTRIWHEVPNIQNGYFQECKSDGGFGPSFTDLYESYIDKNGYTRYWDDISKAPYLYNGKDFISYDDEQSIAHKCRYIKDNGLLGIMYWEHGCDKTRLLLDAINNNL